MVFENIINAIFDPILSPLLTLHPALSILIIAFTITLLITLVYKYTTDQKKMKKLKEQMKEFQKKMKDVSKKDPQKALKMQQEAMKGNAEYMKASFKSTLYTFIPIIIIFGWLNAHMAFYEISPDNEFTFKAEFAEGHGPIATLSSIPDLTIVSNKTAQIQGGEAVWRLKGDVGEYKLIVDYNNEKYEKKLLISENRKYSEPEKRIQDSKLKRLIIGNEKVRPLEPFNLFGWHPGWLGTYIIFSIAFSIGIRKLLNVY
jgi:uncharacterized membrane protein (DUF106 family)